MSRHENDPPPLGRNGRAPLEEAHREPAVPAGASCRTCRHWRAPPSSSEEAYERFRLGLSRQRVRRPSGTCDRVVLSPGRAPAFAATVAEFACPNFEAKPPAPPAIGGGFVTISEGGRIIWQGPEEYLPAQFRQEELDLPPPPRRSLKSERAERRFVMG